MRRHPTSLELAAGCDDLSAIGLLHPDDGQDEAMIRLIVAGAVLRAGHGPLTLDWHAGGLDVVSGSLVWIVATNKGWAHLRGLAWAANGSRRLPFRADLFSAAEVGDPGPDRCALRVYASGADPNLAGPTHKVQGWLAAGSIRLSRGS